MFPDPPALHLVLHRFSLGLQVLCCLLGDFYPVYPFSEPKIHILRHLWRQQMCPFACYRGFHIHVCRESTISWTALILAAWLGWSLSECNPDTNCSLFFPYLCLGCFWSFQLLHVLLFLLFLLVLWKVHLVWWTFHSQSNPGFLSPSHVCLTQLRCIWDSAVCILLFFFLQRYIEIFQNIWQFFILKFV